ncbi:MAG: DNA repair ATPase [Burkholderiales bacterium]|nr:DNA repair ATPase [Burkholderiales bacterium]
MPANGINGSQNTHYGETVLARTVQTNPLIFRSGLSVGSIAAETDDEFLFDCFIENPAVQACLNVQSPTMVLAGRTGSGKTAILRHVQRAVPHSSNIDPSEMALSYVANSDALRFIQAIGGDLDVLFIALWRHVLCLEFIRLKYNVSSEAKSTTVYGKIVDTFKLDARRQRAINYLRQWQGKFWITIDQNIKELTEKYEENLKIEIGGEIEKFKAGGQYEKRLSSDKKSEILSRAKKIINSEQLTDLSNVVDMLADLSDSDIKNYYILIDKLDERWVDDAIRFKMIRALIDALKQFKKIRNLKIIAALRSDVLERVVQETGDLGFQREKFEEYFHQIRWKKPELRQLIEKRISYTFKKQYSSQSTVQFTDVFTQKINNEDTFDYLVERTLMRPRDIMSFINEAFAISEGKNNISGNTIKTCEHEYSRKRREALEYEWRSAFEAIPELIKYLSRFKKSSIAFNEFCEQSNVDDLALKILETRLSSDPIRIIADQYCNSNVSAESLMKEIASVLYRVGAVGLKIGPADKMLYSHINAPLLDGALLNSESRVRIHPMLFSSFGIDDEERRRPRITQL